MPKQRYEMDLAGEWRFALDPYSIGAPPYTVGWYEEHLPDTIRLPGSVTGNRKGIKTTVFNKHWVMPTYGYSGVAWYQRDVEIPQDWNDKHIELVLERAQATTVWIDDNKAGTCDNREIEQIFDISRIATPGKHTITIRNDSSRQRPHHANRTTLLSGGNGIYGKICVRVTDKVFIQDISIKPHLSDKTAELHIWIANQTGTNAWGELIINIASLDGSHRVKTKRQRFLVECSRKCKLIEHEVYMGEDVRLWDEFDPAVYEVTIDLKARAGDKFYQDTNTARFGMREFTRKGTHFAVNGKTIFLRGDAVNHTMFVERSGRNPYSVEDWKEIMRIYKEYGINHIRFHTHVPPKAAFSAADEIGMYIQCELTIGGTNGMTVPGPDSIDWDPMLEPVMKRKAKEILNWLKNHPSFVMFTLGNEINGDRSILERLVKYLRTVDSTRLYAQGTNNYLRNSSLAPDDDFWVTEKVSERENVRGSVSHIYPPLGPVQDELPRNSLRDYSEALRNIPIPVVAHEMGQYETTFNYDEINKFNHDLEIPANMYHAKKVMEERGLSHKEKDFYRDSGKLSLLCYKEDIETQLRTPEMAGFQLMTFSDVQVTGTALTGILNAFFESKGMVEPSAWRQFCSEKVMLLRIESFTFHSGDSTRAKIQIANYGPESLINVKPYWKLVSGEMTISKGNLPACDVPQGCLFDLGDFEIRFEAEQPEEFVLEIGLEGTECLNRYNIWVYPELPKFNILKSPEIICTDCVSKAAENLRTGKKVLFYNKMLSMDKTLVGFFASNFWALTSFSGEGLNQFQTWPNEPPRGCMTPPGTMGISYDPMHPVFKYFPGKGHSDYQWFPIIMNSNPVILDSFPEPIDPIIWTIDDPQRGHRAGTLFEALVGNGKLMVCAADLYRISEIQAKWLKKGILEYMQSERFTPKSSFCISFFEEFFSK